jgi:DNA-binding CsgD family transcriptional regulator
MMLHHVGKEGHQRGTSAKEDHLDLSMILKQPPDYVPENGAAFIVTFTKSRLSFNELHLIQDTKFQLVPDDHGRLSWAWGSIRQETRREVINMIGQGMTYDEIAGALQISKGRISQIKKEAIEKGIIDAKGKVLKDDF